MPITSSEKIRNEVVRIVAQDKGGKSARDLVQTVVSTQHVQAELVQQALRRLLEQGALVIGPNMNLLKK
jgi:chemotaxis receptor (MCP) glutamine deamidase CheD